MQKVLIQMQKQGTLTLPADLRAKYGIEPGDSLWLIDLEGVLVLTTVAPLVPKLAREIERMRLEAGLSIEDLMDGLREQREQSFRERYGSKESTVERRP